MIPHLFGFDHICDEDQAFDQFSHGTFAGLKHRILVTFDDDFLALDAAGMPHSGIVFSQAGKSKQFPIRITHSPGFLNSKNIDTATP